MPKTDHFEDLKAVVGVLRKHEVRIARQFIVCFDRYKTPDKNKSLRLFNLIHKKPEITKEQAIKKVNPEVKPRSFERFCRRLLDKVEESLILEVSIQASKYKPRTRAEFRLNRQLLSLKILDSRDLKEYSIGQYSLIAQTAEELNLQYVSIKVNEVLFPISALLNQERNSITSSSKAFLNSLNHFYTYRKLSHSMKLFSHLLTNFGSSIAYNQLKTSLSTVNQIIFPAPDSLRIMSLLLTSEHLFLKKNSITAILCLRVAFRF